MPDHRSESFQPWHRPYSLLAGRGRAVPAGPLVPRGAMLLCVHSYPLAKNGLCHVTFSDTVNLGSRAQSENTTTMTTITAPHKNATRINPCVHHLHNLPPNKHGIHPSQSLQASRKSDPWFRLLLDQLDTSKQTPRSLHHPRHRTKTIPVICLIHGLSRGLSQIHKRTHAHHKESLEGRMV